jgi:hypothetical protein
MRTPKPSTSWGYYNFGHLIGIARTKRAAIKEVERHTMSPWAEARRYMQVLKVTVTPATHHQEPKDGDDA